jgi:hypothetical protein
MSRLLLAALLLTTPLAAAPGDKAPPPGEDVLALASDKALIVLQVNGVERAQERLNALLKAAVPDLADKAAQNVREMLAELLEGRDLKALRGDGRLLITIADLDQAADKAGITFLFPVRTADAFKKDFLTEPERTSLKKDGDLEQLKFEDQEVPFYLAELKDYVVVSADRDLTAAYTKGTVAGVSRRASREVSRAFHAGDVSLFVNATAVQAKYGDQLKRYKALAETLLKGEGIQGVNKGQMAQIKGVLDAAFQIVEDGTAAVLTVEFRPDGLRLLGLAQFGDKTPTATALQKYQLAPFEALGTLPAGQAVYSGSNLNLGSSEAAGVMAGGFTADDEDAPAKETLAGLLKDLRSSDHGLVLTAGNMLAAGGLEALSSKEAAKIVDARLKILKALTATGSFANVPLKGKPDIKENAEKVGGFSLHAATVKYDFDKATAELPAETRDATRASMKRALGGDEARFWFGTDGKTVLQVTGPDWSVAKALAEGYLSGGTGIGKDEAFQFTRKQLPAEASMLAVLDAGRTAHSLLGLLRDTAGAVPGLPVQLTDVKAPTGKAAYIGAAVVLTTGHGSFELFVPATAVAQIRALIEPLLDNAD